VSTLLAGVQEATGHLSGRQTAVDTSMATDPSPATCAGHQPSRRRSFRKQRTADPLTGPTRYNFLYSSFKAGPAGGRLRRPSSAGGSHYRITHSPQAAGRNTTDDGLRSASRRANVRRSD
jgi:hypothetical protein